MAERRKADAPGPVSRPEGISPIRHDLNPTAGESLLQSRWNQLLANLKAEARPWRRSSAPAASWWPSTLTK